MPISLVSTSVLDLTDYAKSPDKFTIAEAREILRKLIGDAKADDPGKPLLEKFYRGLTDEAAGKRMADEGKADEWENGEIPVVIEMRCDYYGGTGYCEPCNTYCCCFNTGSCYCA